MAASDEDNSGTEGSLHSSQSGSGEDDNNKEEEDEGEEDDNEEPVNAQCTKHVLMDLRHWKVKPMTAVKDGDMVIITFSAEAEATMLHRLCQANAGSYKQ